MPKHPHQQYDEIFMGNHTDESFRTIPWKTKRYGLCTFDTEGKQLDIRGPFATRVRVQDRGSGGFRSRAGWLAQETTRSPADDVGKVPLLRVQRSYTRTHNAVLAMKRPDLTGGMPAVTSRPTENAMNKIEVILTKAKETKGT